MLALGCSFYIFQSFNYRWRIAFQLIAGIALIMFPGYWGKFRRGIRFSKDQDPHVLPFYGKGITTSTPEFFVKLGGWILIFLPLLLRALAIWAYTMELEKKVPL